MQLRELLIISKGTKVIIAITFSVSIMAIIFAFFYYRNINNSEDPRIRKARELLLQYDNLSGRINSFEGFSLLDSAEAIFKSIADYEFSFETGLIFNNKCSALLLMAIYDSTISEQEQANLLDLSMKYCDSSIAVYREWISLWDDLSHEAIAEKLRPLMNKSDPAFTEFNYDKVFARRVKNITIAQIETPRRLSVSLSNKGTIFRHKLMGDSALSCYRHALALWKYNRTAKSNMIVLMGGEPVKATLIESLFPPDKDKK